MLPADLVVMAVGIRPNASLAARGGPGSQPRHRRRRNDAHQRPRYFRAWRMRGSRRATLRPCRAALRHGQRGSGASSRGDARRNSFRPRPATKLKVTGINLFSAGDFADGEDREEIVLRDGARGIYRRLVLKDNRIVGAVMYGDTSRRRLVLRSAEARHGHCADARDADLRPDLRRGHPAGPNGGRRGACRTMPKFAAVMASAKASITGAIAGLGLKTLDEVRAHTKASASCGSCTGLVEQLLKAQLGDAYNPAAVQPICACTDPRPRRRAPADLRQSSLKPSRTVMQALEWKTSCGCAKCRPALNYYLLCELARRICGRWPVALHQRTRARQHPEGRHLSPLCRACGAASRRRRNCAPSPMWWRSSKSQRSRSPAASASTCWACKKEDLPAVWADLNAAGLVSGHAYGKALRTVKTCVGSDWCRFGTQDFDRARHQD